MSRIEKQSYTTTSFIEVLRQFERGGATGRSRDITFLVNGKPYSVLELGSTGDGLVTDINFHLSQTDLEKGFND